MRLKFDDVKLGHAEEEFILETRELFTRMENNHAVVHGKAEVEHTRVKAPNAARCDKFGATD